MPDMTVHNAMGDRVLAKLPEEISARICSDEFHVGVLGPDPFFFYRFFALPFTNGVDLRGKTMHHKKCGAFLMTFARMIQDEQVQTNHSIMTELAATAKDDKAFSYFCGFLCHYALDSTAHPYINALAAKRPGMHTAVERKLERIELRRQGKQPKDIMRLFRPFPDVPEIRRAMHAVYGWDDDLFRTGYKHMKIFHWIIKDQHGWLAKLVGGKPAKMVALPDKMTALPDKMTAQPADSQRAFSVRELPGPLRILKGARHRILKKLAGKNYGMLCAVSYRNHMADNIDVSGFDALEQEAVDFAVELITAAYNYREGRISEQELAAVIGNRAYSGGEAED